MVGAQSIEEAIDRVEKLTMQIRAERANRFNLAWPPGHAERPAQLKALMDENASLFECVAVIDQLYGPGCAGCDLAQARNQTSLSA